MISVNDFKTGVTIKYNNTLYQVIEFQHVKPGKGSAFVRTKLRNLDNSSIQDITFNAGEKVQKAHIEKSNMQYLYNEGDTYYFMDMVSFDQIEVNKSVIKDKLNFLTENMDVVVVKNEGRIIDVVLPEKHAFEVIDAEPGIKGDTRSGGDKNATIATGYTLRVPLFIESGEKIIVNTVNGNYVSRDK